MDQSKRSIGKNDQNGLDKNDRSDGRMLRRNRSFTPSDNRTVALKVPSIGGLSDGVNLGLVYVRLLIWSISQCNKCPFTKNRILCEIGHINKK